MTYEQYLQKFDGKVSGPEKQKLEKALDLAFDIRKFEIELYWKRATYFWAFIGASLAGYVLVQKSTDPANPWLLLLFSSLGLVFSAAWYLVNRASKFWQNNWEKHVDLLEDHVLGPLYKTIAEAPTPGNPLTAAGEYSVSKINQLLSVFVSVFWLVLFVKSSLPISFHAEIDLSKLAIISFTVVALACLRFLGRSGGKATTTKLSPRQITVVP